MAFLAGEMATAGRINRLQSASYGAIGSGVVSASSTNVDVPSATVTVTTETAGARYVATCVWDYNTLGIPGASSTARMALDGVGQSPLATFRGDAASERGTITQTYRGTLGAAGSYTFKLIASTATNTEVQGVNCSITVEITEVA
ncbi:hypothetical protein [Streptomyces sp. SAS_272]|uniref:hypothetical protein n=1 Tax=Streptomyces sp. SAS_272 TaxID=3412747 RepID=UPI00403C1FFF